MSGFLKPFPRLSRGELEELTGFPSRDGVLTVGLDRRSWSGYRGGFLPYIGVFLAVGLFFGGEAAGLARPLAVGFGSTVGVLATASMIRTVRAARRSHELLAREEGWVAIAWTREELMYRSIEWCALVPWSSVTRIEHIGADRGGMLSNTLWVHIAEHGRLLVEERDGWFAGRRLKDWAEDLEAARASA